MVIFGGLELVAAGYIGYKYSQKKKRRLSEEHALSNPQSSSTHRRRRHSIDAPRRKHKHSSQSPHRPNVPPPPSILKPTAQGQGQGQGQGQYPYSQPAASASWVAPPPGAPPPNQPFGYDYRYNTGAHYEPSMNQNQYNNNQYTYPPHLGPTPVVNQPQWQNASASTPNFFPERGRSPVRHSPSPSTSPRPNTAELSGSMPPPRQYNTHLSPTPHVRFAVANNVPQPGDEVDRDPPPRYEE